MQDVVVLSAVRTPIGAFQGQLRTQQAHQLGALVIQEAAQRAGVPTEAVEQVNMGCVLTAGQGQAPARQAALGAGCPKSAGAVTLNKVCGSAMRAVMLSANDLRCGDYDVAVAGGMESMSNAPYLVPGARSGLRLGPGELVDSMIHDGLWDPYGDVHMGNCAELCAREFGFDREDQDDYAAESYRRANEATESGAFAAEIAAITVRDRRAEMTVDADEDPVRFDETKARKLRPAFDKSGSVTAANASSLSDGAAALVLTRGDVAAANGWTPVARIVAQASVAQEPEWFTTAPVRAIEAVCERAGVGLDAIDLFEINEAFSVVVLACMRQLGISHERVNVHGGAVALGHPIGASGARIVVTLLNALEKRNKTLGCAAICIGGGEATALLVERLS